MEIPIFIRKLIRKSRLGLDGFIGRFFLHSQILAELSIVPHEPITPSNFSEYLYSCWSHFERFRVLPKYRKLSPNTCDLKVYQDSLVYTFILDNFSPGSRLLEIGGGESRIIESLKNQFEIWNLDKLEGIGFGPTKLWHEDGFHLVRDYIGHFSAEVPDDYFDLVLD